MSLRDWLLRLLDRGEFKETSADAMVELEEVWLHEGPMLLQVLKSAGVDASGIESTNVATEATSTTRMRIFVRYEDEPRAKAALDEHRQRLR